MSETEWQSVVVEDVWLAAWLLARGATLGEPIVDRERGEVVFQVEGDRVESDVELYRRGQAVASVHAVRSAIQLLRDLIGSTRRALRADGANEADGGDTGSRRPRGGRGGRRWGHGASGSRAAQGRGVDRRGSA
ncbi:MAG: hypothetical protein ACREQY_19225 [Candidatus Binatia bacterium]